jgi:hypothetical protein
MRQKIRQYNNSFLLHDYKYGHGKLSTFNLHEEAGNLNIQHILQASRHRWHIGGQMLTQ